MSMLSSQIDALRRAAQNYRDFGKYEAEQMMLDAADTIWRLRDDLQRANAAVQDAEHDESMAWDRVRKSEAENAKLRELVRYMWDFSCVVPDEPHTSKEELDYSYEVWKRMRELGIGIEVEE